LSDWGALRFEALGPSQLDKRALPKEKLAAVLPLIAGCLRLI